MQTFVIISNRDYAALNFVETASYVRYKDGYYTAEAAY